MTSYDFRTSKLFKRINERPEYVQTIESIRTLAEAIGAQIARLLPEYTDHGIRHMDALWRVAEAVLTDSELKQATVQELFLLACTFYVHDLGMAAACTSEGIAKIRSSPEYQVEFSRIKSKGNPSADVLALRLASRELHAQLAVSLTSDRIPGLDQYLIENTATREVWGPLIGEVAASHHWSLQEVETRLGRRGIVPTGDGGTVDLAFVACALRIIDYAHINRDRALHLERKLRSEVAPSSGLHWDAQANVTGPDRDVAQLIYGCTAAFTEIEPWWLFYDMVSGLDTEIRGVRDYLDGRKVSAGRLSLRGVKGAESPDAFSSYVTLNSEIAPVDIRVQPSSMERVIELLGGPALYRGDQLAPLRELIQNCRDAILLRNAIETIDRQDRTSGKVDITLDLTSSPPILKVRDNGVGMTRNVVKNHLISVASDFWSSVDFARDFNRAIEAGFQPVGRFGIGFLSVFMFGDYIEVETERAGSPRILLRLRGIGRRGELVEKMPTGRTGTEVRIQVSSEVASLLRALPDVVSAKAPMLPFQVRTEVVSDSGTQLSTIEPKWWQKATSSELFEFLAKWPFMSSSGRLPDKTERRRLMPWNWETFELKDSEWPGTKPEYSDEIGRLIDSGTDSPGVLFCSHGIAVERLSRNGVFGIVEVGEAQLTADRSLLRKYSALDSASFTDLWQGLIPEVRKAVDELEHHGALPARHSHLRTLAKRYGIDLLANSSLPWIPVLEQPGNVVHRSRTELARLLESHSSIIICSGLSAEKAYNIAIRKLSPSDFKSTMAILFSTNEFKVDYNVEKRLEVEQGTSRIRGTLPSLMDRTGCKEDELILLNTAIEIVAGAWTKPSKDLKEQNWEMDADYLRGYLWSQLQRVSE